MFGSLVQKLQSLSPLTSPTTSPTVSPRPKRKFVFGRANRKRRGIVGGYAKEDLREVQSEPELDYENVEKNSKSERRLFGGERRKASAPPVSSSSNTQYPSISFPTNVRHVNSNGNSSKGLALRDVPSSSPYSIAYSGAIRSQTKEDDQNIYEDVHPVKGPHISVYNISSSAHPSNSINVNINSSKNCRESIPTSVHVSGVSEYCSSRNSDEKASNIYDNCKLCPSAKTTNRGGPKSLPDHRKLSQNNPINYNTNKSHCNNTNIYAPIKISDVAQASESVKSGAQRKYGTVGTPANYLHSDAKTETRKSSLEARKLTPPDYHRTLSSDCYNQQSNPYRVDEPYPLPPTHEDIYDVPARIARKVESRPSRPAPQVSRTVGKMEGLRQVCGFD